MLIKDQIRTRREQLGLSLVQLAQRIGLTEQSLRHWEAGRSNPTKRNAPKLEEALGIQLDWTEGRNSPGPSAANLLNHADIELLLKLTRLPVPVKTLFGRLADEYLTSHVTEPFIHRNGSHSIEPFVQRTVQGELPNAGSSTHRKHRRSRKASQ